MYIKTQTKDMKQFLFFLHHIIADCEQTKRATFWGSTQFCVNKLVLNCSNTGCHWLRPPVTVHKNNTQTNILCVHRLVCLSAYLTIPPFTPPSFSPFLSSEVRSSSVIPLDSNAWTRTGLKTSLNKVAKLCP